MERLGRVGVHVHGAASASPSLTPCDLLIAGGRVIDPANQIDQEGWDVAVRDGRILAVGANLARQYAASTVHDATGQLVTPGLVDAHGHFYRHCTPLGGPSPTLPSHVTSPRVDQTLTELAHGSIVQNQRTRSALGGA